MKVIRNENLGTVLILVHTQMNNGKEITSMILPPDWLLQNFIDCTS